MISVNKVSRKFGDTVAVSDLSFTVEDGRIQGLLGPNGAGKSTTIRMILGILNTDSGTIEIDGIPPSEFRSQVGYLPEERGLYKKETVEGMLLYLGRLKGSKPTELLKGMDYWLERFELGDCKKKKIDELSKGMSQKVQFISTVLHNPQLLILDEPFSGLDPVSVDTLRSVITDLSAEGKTILFSTHVMEQAEKICQDILLMASGRCLLSGKLEEVKGRFGSQTIRMEFDGNGSFLSKLPMVERINLENRFCEVTLTSLDSSDGFLQAAAKNLSIRKFSIEEPSLHSIFVTQVEEANRV